MGIVLSPPWHSRQENNAKSLWVFSLVIDVLFEMEGRTRLPVSRSILNGIRVLVVEDDDDTRDLLSYVLGSHGATVFLSSSVAEGLATLRKEHPHVVVTDIGMPGHNGYAFIAAVRKEEA